MYLVCDVIGLGRDPSLIGVLNAYVSQRPGVNVRRYSMSTAAFTTLIGGLLFVAAAQNLQRDIDRTTAE
jgi:hypothetical protein